MTPTQQTLIKMRKLKYTCFVTEYYHFAAHVRKDLAGFIDVLCLKENEIIGVQTTSLSNVQARVQKILKHKNYLPVKKSGIKILVQGFGKKKIDGKIVNHCEEIYL